MRELIENPHSYSADIHSSLPYGLISLPHGDTIFLNKEDSLRHLSVLELPKDKVRGNHYHVKRQEHLYILRGKVWGYYWDPNHPKDNRKTLLNEGQLVTVPPGLAHALKASEDSLAIEFSPCPFDIEDYYFVENPFLCLGPLQLIDMCGKT